MKQSLSIRMTAACLLLFLTSIYRFITPVNRNAVRFITDEAYWTHTASTLYMLMERDFRNPEWHEFWGFTNFNGAKYVFGIGLLMQGISTVDDTGIPPETYTKWRTYENRQFPDSIPVFRELQRSRRVSAAVTSLAVVLTFVVGWLIFSSILPAMGTAVIVLFHPLTYYVGTHALSDGILLFAELLFLIPVLYIAKALLTDAKADILPVLFAGVSLGFLTSVKINGAMFGIVAGVILLFADLYSPRETLKTSIFYLLLIGCIGLGVFLILEPNLFFYPEYPLTQMLSDRIAITEYHIQYFLKLNPSHITLAPVDKLQSFVRNLFPAWMGILAGLGTIGLLEEIIRKHQVSLRYIVYLSGLMLVSIMFTYIVFDEGRYYLPFLPFLAIFGSSWLIHTRLASWRRIIPALSAVLQRLSHVR